MIGPTGLRHSLGTACVRSWAKQNSIPPVRLDYPWFVRPPRLLGALRWSCQVTLPAVRHQLEELELLMPVWTSVGLV